MLLFEHVIHVFQFHAVQVVLMHNALKGKFVEVTYVQQASYLSIIIGYANKLHLQAKKMS